MVKINGIEYNALPSYSSREFMMSFVTDLTYAQLEALFGAPCSIEIIERNETVAKFYSKELISISKREGKATIAFSISIFEGDKQEEILNELSDHQSTLTQHGSSISINGEDINNADSALVELAMLIDQLEGRVEDLELAVFPIGGNENG